MTEVSRMRHASASREKQGLSSPGQEPVSLVCAVTLPRAKVSMHWSRGDTRVQPDSDPGVSNTHFVETSSEQSCLAWYRTVRTPSLHVVCIHRLASVGLSAGVHVSKLSISASGIWWCTCRCRCNRHQPSPTNRHQRVHPETTTCKRTARWHRERRMRGGGAACFVSELSFPSVSVTLGSSVHGMLTT